MTKTILAVTIAALMSAQASAYTLHSEGGTELNLDIEAVFGVFTSKENYATFGKTDGGGSDWQEGYIKYGLSGSHAYQSRSEEHTSELQSRPHLVCRLLLEKKKRGTAHRGRRRLARPSTCPRTRASTTGRRRTRTDCACSLRA